ncbi:MAG: DUF1501 domain-containing protein [Planctomycetes bacterium]|nr:DUF1501 domain-containing protein [Planctomycetota bacterium]
MDPGRQYELMLTRRQLFDRTKNAVGAAALASLLGRSAIGAPAARTALGGLPDLPHFAPRAKRAIYLFQSGAPSHIDLFDYKPTLAAEHGKELPASVRGTQRVTGMTVNQKQFLVAGPLRPFRQHGQCGRWLSDLIPHTASLADEMCLLKAVHTEAINHDPGITFINTGNQQIGHPSLGAWLSYGLGSENQNLPAYMVLISQGTGKNPGQPIFARLWGSGYLPSRHQGVRLRPGSNPVLYLANPAGVEREDRRHLLDDLAAMNEHRMQLTGDPEIETRLAQYEMAYRMQASVPDLTDLSDEPAHTFEMYGPESRTPGSYAANCLLARRMIERGVRFVQLFHRGWDQHDNLKTQLTNQCRDTDQPTAALVNDLKQRGLLDETLVIWGGEFGRTAYSQGALGNGRDHHGRCFSVWMAGGGVKPGIEHGATDDYCYNIASGGVHIHDLNATILHCLGIDHERLTFRFQGLDQRLTGVETHAPVFDVLA